MLFDRPQVHKMEQRPNRREDRVVEFATFLISQMRGLNERRRALQILLKKHWGFDPARVALKNRRPIFQIRHNAGTDAQVIAEQIELSDFFFGPIDAIETGQ